MVRSAYRSANRQDFDGLMTRIEITECLQRVIERLFLTFLTTWDEPNLTNAAGDWTNFALACARACQKLRDKLESFRLFS
jgi:hypothetical protein